VLLGQPAPAVSGSSVLDPSVSFDLSAVAADGRWTVVNFFATWCGPCIEEHPELIEWHRRHAQIGDAALVSVVWTDSAENAQQFFTERGGDWPVLHDDGARIGSAYGVVAMPESYLVDPQSIVRAKVIGGVTTNGLDELLLSAQGVS
jgi:cytochrome c biogenesis protein CcmG, thiol:disulfide interchange protein DsbE